MKIYNNSEVMAMLVENPKLEFECKFDERQFTVKVIRNQIVIKNSFSHDCGFSLNDRWTLVEKSVSFMEAMKAFSEGKTIRHDGDFPHTFVAVDSVFEIKDDRNNGITVNEILNCKWFIEGNK